ncbi:patatin-like phospholipase family protein [Dokdonia pacifica]|uniref:Patatin-like phospholipase n=1 Tax=Dokdonia pacifica TaxID=1627892 RepID=A0A238WQM5_9FLAO|nr:patatin-like phospholipase family protein [Dokdonia pacifica]SNR48835.1 Patatin-like phospholipase [Dokdonia pacifica]
MTKKLVSLIRGLRSATKDFTKSSFLSLLVLGLILLILFKMDQAYTMMVYMLEEDKSSLFLCFFFVNALAVTLSHYPIYTYYSQGFNKSKDAITWEDKRIKFSIFKKFNFSYPYFIYRLDTKDYKMSVTANVLRYCIGIVIYAVWVIFIYKSVRPNLLFNDQLGLSLQAIAWIIGVFFMFPIIIYSIIKYRIVKDKIVNKTALYTRITRYYFLATLLSVILLTYILISDTIFSRYGFILVMLCTYCMMFCYVFFRLVRSKTSDVYDSLDPKNKLRIFIKALTFFENPLRYLQTFVFVFVIAMLLITYWSMMALLGGELGNNVIPILLVYLFAYYWIIANVGKYLFVANSPLKVKSRSGKKIKYCDTRTYKLTFLGITLLAVLAFVSFFFAEQKTHEIETVANVTSASKVIDEATFIKAVKEIKEDRVFFVSSYGGGLKANAWTINVLQKIQEETNHDFLNQTISLSGASGGSLGLAIYTGLYAHYGTDDTLLRKKIDAISREDYASADLTFTLGLDLYRKLWPLTNGLGLQDRSYYSMIKYQNFIEETPDRKILSDIAYRQYWADAFKNEKNGAKGYFPSLIMNTAGVRANRGILWSVKDSLSFDAIFSNADNLADLYKNKDKTLPYYQAVSMTNRFPGLSPAAKIKGYGHYMDAGVIDNSGLLGNLDVFNYLRNQTKDSLFSNKKVVFIDIINSKTLYLDHLMDEFIEGGFDVRSIDESEKDNIVVNLTTALNYNKIPKYLSDFFTNWGKSPHTTTTSLQGKVAYYPIYLPHKITVKDIEKHISGTYDKSKKQQLDTLLSKHNEKILTMTGTDTIGFFDKWQYYEPTLSRHMGESSYKYMKRMLDSNEYINKVINEVNGSKKAH